MDGSKPKTTPISVENPTDTTMDVPLIATGVDDIFEITSASPIPAATPVSYTHLDVYKRQHRNLKILIIFSKIVVAIPFLSHYNCK